MDTYEVWEAPYQPPPKPTQKLENYHHTITLTLKQSLCGFEKLLKFKHLDGKIVPINRYSVTPHGWVEVFPGLGRMKEVKDEEGQRGDLVVEFRVVVEFEKITVEVKEELKRILGVKKMEI